MSSEFIASAPFRLRTCLAENCLLQILENLNAVDLMQMSRVNDYFKNLITKEIISKKLLNLCKLSQASKNEILETFGTSMTKFAIDEINLNNFLDTVMKYCSPARLVRVELNLMEPVTVDLDKIEQSMAFFTNAYRIKLNVHWDGRHNFDHFLERLLETANNLYNLQLRRVEISGELFMTNPLKKLGKLLLFRPHFLFEGFQNKANLFKNLNVLRIVEPNFFSDDILTRFILNSPNLKMFVFKGSNDIMSKGTMFCKTLVTRCSKLKNFSDFHTPISVDHETVDLQRYTFLSSFSQLAFVSLTSYTFCGSDLYYPLLALRSNNIRKIQIFSNFHTAVPYSGSGADRERIIQTLRPPFVGFRSLQQLKLFVQNGKPSVSGGLGFIMQFAANLINLAEFSLSGGTTANTIIELLHKFNTVSISDALFEHLSVEMRGIVSSLRTIRQALETKDKGDLSKLVVNIHQWRELQAYKDVNNLIEIILDPDLKPYNYEPNDLPLAVRLC